MKQLLMIAFALMTSTAWGKVSCDASQASKDPGQPGKIIYEMSPDRCASATEDSTTCFRQIEVDRDFCKDEKTVIKQACKGDLPAPTEVACGGAKVCRSGACVPR